MITRYVFIRLKPEYSHEDARHEAAQMAQAIIPTVPAVKRVYVGLPADDKCGTKWDISLALVFDSYDDIAAFRAHPVHREYVDEYILPRVAKLRTWNFETEVL